MKHNLIQLILLLNGDLFFSNLIQWIVKLDLPALEGQRAKRNILGSTSFWRSTTIFRTAEALNKVRELISYFSTRWYRELKYGCKTESLPLMVCETG